MTDKKTDLRQQAEEKAAYLSENIETQSPEETRETLHELLVHQIELTMQNEELRRMQAELETARARYFDLYDMAPVGYVTLSEQGLILEANLTAANLLGAARRSALVKRPLSQFILKEDQDIYYQQRKEISETHAAFRQGSVQAGQAGEPQAWELRMIKVDGTAFWARFEAAAAQGADGAPTCRIVISNIDERKRTEEVIKTTIRFQQVLMDAVPSPIFYKDAKCVYIGGNKAFEQYLGLSPEQFIGKTVYEISPAELAEKYDKADRELLNNPGVQTYEASVVYADGTLHDVVFNKATFTNREGKVVGLIGVILDITEQKRSEKENTNLTAQIQQAQKMESVGRLAGGVAHDFNNMLGVILGHTEMAMDQVDPAQPLHADLEEIRTAANRSADLTSQLLAFARKQMIAPKILDLNKTVTSMLKMLRRLIGEDIHLNWQPDANLWPVKVDPSQIDQILANLCINARDAISDIGKMTIETGNCSFDEDYCAAYAGFPPGEYVLLAVSDNGCGMDKETLSHLFEPFYTTKVIGKGTGLGLATVYGIVRQNNGFINVYSEPNQGTTFKIYLPRHVGKAEQLRTKGPAEAASRGHETILLVEDEPSILAMTARMLVKQGYTVLSASTPGAAIRLARERSGEIHLLMTDVVMPEMNGRDLAKNLLSLFPHLKRLFMSGYTANVIAHHGVLDEGVYFIQKPFSIKELAAKVREALDQE